MTEAENEPKTEEKPTDVKKRPKKPPAKEGTAWWEYALIFAVLSYKIYTPLPEDIEDRYPRSFLLFGQKAIFKFGHYIRIVSPGAELSYLRGATNGIAKIIKKDVQGVTESVHPLTNFDLHVFTPNDNAENGAIYYIHGGGWLIGEFPMYSTYLKNMALETGKTIIAPNYRLAPDHPFPIPFDDCLEGIEHTFKNAKNLKINSENIVLSGDDIGATMALSISFTLANQPDRKFKAVSVQNPATQNLLWTLPSQQLSGYFSLSNAQMAWGWANYVNGENGYKHREYIKGSAYLQAKKKHKAQFKLVDPFEYFAPEELKNADGKNWNPPAGDFMAQEIPEWMPESVKKMVDYRVAPLFTSDALISAVSTETHIFVAEYDTLRDEGMMMAKRLEKAGVKATSTHQKGSFHCDFLMSTYFAGIDLMVPSADRTTKAYFDHLKKL